MEDTKTPEEVEKTTAIRNMFGAIAPTYDTLNRILSFGVDQGWRRHMVSRLPRTGPLTILDLACGTGDVSIEIVNQRPQAIVCGGDITIEMLKAGVPKLKKKRLDDAISYQACSAEDLPYKSETFDGTTIAFGIRNVIRRDRALGEMARVLKSGATALILDFSIPPNPLVRAFYGFYFHKVLPLIGGLISGNMEAYKYLPRSVEGFPPREEFVALMEENGFEGVTYSDFTFGVATLYQGFKR